MRSADGRSTGAWLWTPRNRTIFGGFRPKRPIRTHARSTAALRSATTGKAERYWLTHCRRLGANKMWREGTEKPALYFSVWAPNAQQVEAVIGEPVSGYIWSDGRGVKHAFKLARGDDGIWSSDPTDPALADFSGWDHQLYMFRIRKDDHTEQHPSIAYRTDLYSRCQVGSGRKKPEDPREGEPPWNGARQDLDGTKGCSVVIDPETVTKNLDDENFPPAQWDSEEEFWANEYDALRPVPDRHEDHIIYEMHVGGLGAGLRDANGNPLPGTFKDAVALLDHLVELGVNAVELMPMSEAEGWTWGYGTSHYFATEYSGGGRDQFKHFVRACHQRGIAVLLDVVYKLYVLLKRRPELALAAFRQKLIDDRAEVAARFGLDHHLVGFSRDPLYGFGEPPFDAVEVLAVRDLALLGTLLADRSFSGSLTARPYVHETYAFNFVAREHWIIPPGGR